MSIKKGEVYIATLDPTIGGEIKKTRPVVVVSNNINNKYNKTVSILPITSNTDKVYPFEVYVGKGIGNLPKDSKIKADQIRTIDKSRLIKLVGNLPKDYLTQIDIALKIHLEID
jgi:mRNA interferase MazF